MIDLFAECGADEPCEDIGGGLERCGRGAINRVSSAACELNAPPDPGVTSEANDVCVAHSECGAGALCTPVPDPDAGQLRNICVATCLEDADCSAGRVCVCGGALDYVVINTCAAASCATASDCAESACGVQVGNGCDPSVLALACRGDDDRCELDCRPDQCRVVVGDTWADGGSEDNCN